MHVISYVRAKKEKVSTYASFMDSSSVTHVEKKIIFSDKKRTQDEASLSSDKTLLKMQATKANNARVGLCNVNGDLRNYMYVLHIKPFNKLWI